MLEGGNPGLTLAESRAHFSLWAIMTVPLLAGNDVRNIKPENRSGSGSSPTMPGLFVFSMKQMKADTH